MRIGSGFLVVTLTSCIALLGLPSQVFSQTAGSGAFTVAAAELPDAPLPQADSSQSSSQPATGGQGESAQQSAEDAEAKHTPPPQPKRILGIMPNYRAVSAGQIPPPPTPREAFMIATENSFDYSAFVFVGITSLLAKGTDAHPQLGKGVGGLWAYTWRGYVDKTDGNYLVDFVFPTLLRQDERYYAMGEGGIVKRGFYAASRVLITPNYHGHNSFNTSEILGRGISEAVSLAYYPSQTQSASGFTEKFAYAVGRDAFTNVFREFWPDINSHVLHRRH
jgi:hypothetical protein